MIFSYKKENDKVEDHDPDLMKMMIMIVNMRQGLTHYAQGRIPREVFISPSKTILSLQILREEVETQ